ncbi:hypothetical protein Ark11_1481 [Candidatus Ichthyocystis hellenicum]|uniref:Uncharacterized protein n=1 Tax=Candidatus Ichthyocystis hellenicum TaxID=1561003 RepID=A0A0S4M3C3_9BURK|nr:hypothetical protein [Candidatus Ichthyocystis hellenicum]CUT18279.1 hypothetical protein Ark11_1481 [Candidatus Ichthyocystis hellenicum]
MNSYSLGNNFTADVVDEKEDIKSNTNNITTEHLSYQNQYVTNILAKHEPSYRLLDSHNSDELFQDDDYQKILLPPDIFKLNKSDECNPSSKTGSLYIDKPYTSRALKRILPEDEPSSTPPSSKKIDLKTIADNKKNHSTCRKVPERPIIKKELYIKLYPCDIKKIMCTEKICNASPLTLTEHITEKSTFVEDEEVLISPDIRKSELKQIPPQENTIKKNISSGELPQYDYYQKRLLPPDIFKLNKLDECTLSSKTGSIYTSKPFTYSSQKRTLVEDESSTQLPPPKKIDLNQIIDNEESHIFAEEIITALDFKKGQNHSASCKVPVQPIIKKKLVIKLYRYDIKQSMYTKKVCTTSSLTPIEQITEKNTSIGDETPSISTNLRRAELKLIPPQENTIKKNISLKLYTRSNLWHTKTNLGVLYRDAVKKISIDNDGLFKNTVLEKIGIITKRRGLLKSSINLSPTYSNIRKFALDKIYSLFDDSAIDSGMLITPGISISDIRSTLISNNIFFKKLQKYCKKISEDVLATPDSCFSHIFQSYANFNLKYCSNTNNIKIKLSPKKNKFLPALKELIIDTMSNLPKSIVLEIEKLDQINIVNALFVDVHGALVSKSLIKNLNLLFNSNKNKFANKKFDDNLSLFNDLLEKIVNMVRASCIFYEGIFLPDEPTAEKLSRYLLSDMYSLPSKFNKKIKFPAQNTLKIDNFILDSNNEKSVSDIKAKKMEINDDHDYDQIATTSVTSNIDQSEQRKMIKEFILKSYCKANLFSAENTSNIYEDATKKIIIDNNCLFKNKVLEEFGTYITSRGITKSSINLSKTYSNVRKYILDKFTPFINDAITTTDVLITPGMHLSDLSYNLVSNGALFERLSKNCEEIVKSIHLIPNNYFLSIIQSYIYFNPTERLLITKKKKKLCLEVKLIIVETISNLTNNIIHELKKFKPNEVVDGLFANIHGVYLPKSLIRKLRLIFNSNNLPVKKSKPDLNSINNLLMKVVSEVEICPILHEGKIFSLGKSTAKILSKYLLSDMYSIPEKIKKKLAPHKYIRDNALESNHEKSSATNNADNVEPPLLESPILIPQKRLNWDTALISPLNIYKSALSMIDIDKDYFECSFIDKIRNYSSATKNLSKNEKINVDLSITYNNVKNYILETFSPFLKEIEEETRAKIKITNGMTIDKLKLTYASNKEFLDKLYKFCTKVINRINSSRNATLADLIQYRIPLGTEISKVIRMNKKRKNLFINEIANLLVKNILNAQKVITNKIKLISNAKFLEEHFSNFYDIYVDNASLLKAKSVFDTVHKKVANDHLLIKIADKISLDIVDKIRKGNRICKIINSNIVCGKLSTYNYIRKLVGKELPNLKYTINNPIFIIRDNKIETADQKTRDKILINLESDLIETTIKSYNKLFLKRYRSYKSKN